MWTMRTLIAPLLATFAVVIAACGGGDKPPPQTSGGGDGKHIDSATGKDMAKVDEQAWKEAGLAIPPDADAGGGSSSTPASKPPDPGPADECTPAGVDFEKRNREKLKECYREGKKKDPNLEGTVRLAVSI